MKTKQITNEQKIRREVIRQIPHFRLYAVGSGCIALMLQLVGLIPPAIMQKIVDEYIPAGAVRELCIGLVWFVLLPILSTGLSAFYKYLTAVECRRMSEKLTISAMERLMAQPVSYFDDKNSAELATYCRKDALQYIYLWLVDIPGIIAGLLQGLVVFGVLAKINLWIAAAALLYCPVSYFPSIRFGKKAQKLTGRIMEANGKMMQIVTDTLKSVGFVKAMSAEKQRLEQLRTVSQGAISVWGRMVLNENMTYLWINQFSNGLFTGLLFAMGAFFTMRGTMTVGQCILILSYAGSFFTAAQAAMATNYGFRQQLGEFGKLFEILTLPVPEQTGSRAFRLERELVLRDISFTYEESRGAVLKGLNLTVRKGEWLGIVGQSGAGKSTIFDLLIRLYEPDGGAITADGVPLEAFTLQSLRREIMRISQETVLFPGTIRDNLLLAKPDAGDGEMLEALGLVRLREFVQRLPDGLDTAVGEGGLLLSGGERQRLGLAQGLLRGSSILLLDEVTANVDQESEAIIRDLLRKLADTRGLTILSISHRPEFLACADRIVEVKEGRAFPAEGSPA